ncbi:unnamed protein product [Brassicogethes aeneus]|uniref:RING-type E3 ubiquitin transferase n=1 Tax=Brassicogethes aeneus TaxID=1431903 RepID=A0A9P0FKC5_BRAAE|nr:unnamed protein product [Brassicogethes aeneus]
MVSDTFLTTALRSTLVCSTCEGCLSYFPIHTNENGNYCGRCLPPEMSLRNEIYEKLASINKFPCLNNAQGCMQFIIPSKVPDHEQFCKYRKISCPVVIQNNKCNWQGLSIDIFAHFEKNHLTYIMQNSKVEINFVHNYENNYLLPYFDDYYIVNINTNTKEGLCSFKITYLGSNPESKKFICKLKFQSVNKQDKASFEFKIFEKSIHTIKEIKEALKDPAAIEVYFELYKKYEAKQVEDKKIIADAMNTELLDELECPVCFFYMVPPIMQCEKGHSICKPCSLQVKECPTCKNGIKDTQNFALEKISRMMTYPCKFDLCTFKGKFNIIRNHESKCRFGEFVCPLKEYDRCNWMRNILEMPAHVEEKHLENLLELETVVMPFNATDMEDCFILKYDFQLFILHLKFADQFFYFSLQLVGPQEDSVEYSYEIDIIDCSGGKRRFYFTDQCNELTDKNMAFELGNIFQVVSYQQIQNLITDQFGFRISILK